MSSDIVQNKNVNTFCNIAVMALQSCAAILHTRHVLLCVVIEPHPFLFPPLPHIPPNS